MGVADKGWGGGGAGDGGDGMGMGMGMGWGWDGDGDGGVRLLIERTHMYSCSSGSAVLCLVSRIRIFTISPSEQNADIRSSQDVPGSRPCLGTNRKSSDVRAV